MKFFLVWLPCVHRCPVYSAVWGRPRLCIHTWTMRMIKERTYNNPLCLGKTSWMCFHLVFETSLSRSTQIELRWFSTLAIIRRCSRFNLYSQSKGFKNSKRLQMYATANRLQSNFRSQKVDVKSVNFKVCISDVFCRHSRFLLWFNPLDRYRNGRSSSRSSVEYPLQTTRISFFYWKHISP